MGRDYFALPRPRLFGHRGAAGVVPENTMPSFRRALTDGAEYLELDVHATIDGVVVVIHDTSLERTTDGGGLVRDVPFADLRRLDAGFHFGVDDEHPFRGQGIRVPALREVIEEFPDVPLNIEIKQSDPPIEREVVKLLHEMRAANRVVLAAEDHAIMERIRSADQAIATSFSAFEVRDFFDHCFAGTLDRHAPSGRALQIPPRFADIELATPETIEAAHALGIEVHLWTINDPSEMRRFLEWGADGLMSDFPERLVRTARSFREKSEKPKRPAASGSARNDSPKRARAEHRAHPRSSLGTKGVLRFADGKEIAAIVLDVSFGGAKIEIVQTGDPQRLVGQTLTLDVPTITDDAQGRVGLLNGKIVRAERRDGSKISLGIRFAEGTASRLKNVLRRP
jgi:glycerophosphoryl diester phosphodiesterase